MPNDDTVIAMPPSHRRSRASATSNPKRNVRAWDCLAAPCWISEPSANQKAAHSATTTAIAILTGPGSRAAREGTPHTLLRFASLPGPPGVWAGTLLGPGALHRLGQAPPAQRGQPVVLVDRAEHAPHRGH